MTLTVFEEPCATTEKAEVSYAGSGTTKSINRITPTKSLVLRWFDTTTSCSEEPDAETEDVIILRELSKEAAKDEVLELIKSKPGIGFYDISVKLKLELGFIVEVCEELISEGRLLAKEPLA